MTKFITLKMIFSLQIYLYTISLKSNFNRINPFTLSKISYLKMFERKADKFLILCEILINITIAFVCSLS